MVKRGSITVFLALTLGLILSLLSSGLESARMAAARTQILNGMDIGLYSLFGQYNKSFLKDFDLFAVDGACGGKEMNLASIYDNLESLKIMKVKWTLHNKKVRLCWKKKRNRNSRMGKMGLQMGKCFRL